MESKSVPHLRRQRQPSKRQMERAIEIGKEKGCSRVRVRADEVVFEIGTAAAEEVLPMEELEI
jgi:hypothetical protein